MRDYSELQKQYFGGEKDFRVFSDSELQDIWQQYFGLKYSLGHIASNFSCRKKKIIKAIETDYPAMLARQKKSIPVRRYSSLKTRN